MLGSLLRVAHRQAENSYLQPSLPCSVPTLSQVPRTPLRSFSGSHVSHAASRDAERGIRLSWPSQALSVLRQRLLEFLAMHGGVNTEEGPTGAMVLVQVKQRQGLSSTRQEPLTVGCTARRGHLSQRLRAC